MKRILLIIFAIASNSVLAQDILVLKSGDEQEVKITKVGTEDIDYKKWSNQDGPDYSVKKSDVFMIKYKNGDKDVFNDSPKSETKTEENFQTPQKIEKEPAANNSDIISKTNNLISFNREKTDKYFKGKVKEAKRLKLQWGLSKESVVSTEDVEISIKSVNQIEGSLVWGMYIIQITNKTDNLIYIDKANCFRINKDKTSKCYYNPEMQMSASNGNSLGGSIGLGAITGVLGVGGAIGNLANGISVGGKSNNSTSTTFVQQRIITIPPHSTANLSEYKTIGSGNNKQIVETDESLPELSKDDFKLLGKINMGEEKNITEEVASYKYILTYSTDPQFLTYSSINFELSVIRAFGFTPTAKSDLEIIFPIWSLSNSVYVE